MAFEQELPVWLAPGNDPSEEAKNNGWGMGQHPPADWFNWQWNRTYLALKELQQMAVSKDDISDVDLTPLETEINKLKQSTTAHWADEASLTAKGHVQLSDDADSENSNMAATPNSVRKMVEQNGYRVSKSNKDSNGIYTTVQHFRKSNGKLVRKSVLSGGTSPQYTTRTISYYKKDGIAIEKTETFTLSYDADGDLISEV